MMFFFGASDVITGGVVCTVIYGYAFPHLTESFFEKAVCTSVRYAARTGCPLHPFTMARRYTAAAPETWGEWSSSRT